MVRRSEAKSGTRSSVYRVACVIAPALNQVDRPDRAAVGAGQLPAYRSERPRLPGNVVRQRLAELGSERWDRGAHRLGRCRRASADRTPWADAVPPGRTAPVAGQRGDVLGARYVYDWLGRADGGGVADREGQQRCSDAGQTAGE